MTWRWRAGRRAWVRRKAGSGRAAGAAAGLSGGAVPDSITYIGYPGVAAEGAAMRIGTGQSKTFIAGIRGVTTGNANAIAVMVDSAGQLGTVSSSRRVKADIREVGERSRALHQLRPVSFRYRTHPRCSGCDARSRHSENA